MCKNTPLYLSIFFLGILILVPRLEGLELNATEVEFPLKKGGLITRVQLNTNKPSGDYWINLGDITIRDGDGKEIKYGNTTNVYFGNKGNWGGLPVQHLWDDSPTSMGHSSREVENLVIELGAQPVGSIQITNRTDCCWHRIAGYRLSVYGQNNEELGSIDLDKPDDPNNPTNTLVGQGKSVRYKLKYPTN